MIDLGSLLNGIKPYVLGWIDGHEAAGCRVMSGATQSINSGSLTPLTFDTELNDPASCWAVDDPGKLYAPVDGYYLAGGMWTMTAAQNTAASRILVEVRLNGTTSLATNELHSIAGKAAQVNVTAGMFWMAAGEYIEILAFHDEGSAKNTSGGSSTNQWVNGWLAKM